MKDIRSFLIANWYILVFAFLVRFLIMPFTFHTDMKVHYFHAHFFQSGVINIYEHIKDSRHDLARKDTFNYPPLIYFVQGGYGAVVQTLLGEGYTQWINDWTDSQYNQQKLFKYLFILKIPYILFDIGIGYLLSLLVIEKYRKRTLILWLFNPISLYVIYVLATFDIIPTFCLLLSVYLFKHNKVFLSGLFIGVGSLIKLFPVLFIPFFFIPLILQRKFKQIRNFCIGILLIAFSPLAFLYPSFLEGADSGILSRILIVKISLFSIIEIPIFVILLLFLIIFTIIKKVSIPLEMIVTVIFLFIFMLTNYHPQYLLWVLPFLLLFTVKSNVLILLFYILIPLYFFHLIRFEDRFLTLGVLSPLFPTIYDSGYMEKILFAKINKELFVRVDEFGFRVWSILTLTLIFKNYIDLSKIKFPKIKLPEGIFTFKKIFITLMISNLCIFLSFLLIAALFISRSTLDSENLNGKIWRKIYESQPYVTTMSFTHDNIDTLFLSLNNTNIKNQDSLNVEISNQDKSQLRSFALNGINVGYKDWLKLKFEPLPDSSKSTYTVSLSSVTTNPEMAIDAIVDEQNRINYKANYQTDVFFVIQEHLKKIVIKISNDRIFAGIYIFVIVITIALLIKGPFLKRG